MDKLRTPLPLGLIMIFWLFYQAPRQPYTPFVTPSVFNGIACLDTVNVTLDENCSFLLTPENVAADGLGCLEPNELTVVVNDYNTTNGGLINTPGVFVYVLQKNSGNTCTDFEVCWGYVRAEDKTPPSLTAPPDTTLGIGCEGLEAILNVPESTGTTGRPAAFDNCTPNLSVPFTDHIKLNNGCDSIVIRRTFSTKDASGNTTTADQRIVLVRPLLAEVRVIPEPDSLFVACEADPNFPLDSNGNVHASVTGYPFYINDLGDTITIEPDGRCGLDATYTDERLDICPAAHKLERTWTILDWCAPKGADRRELKQVIKIGDIEPPVAACASDTVFLSTGPFDCVASYDVPSPIVEDNCSNARYLATFIANVPELIIGEDGVPREELRERVIGSVRSDQGASIINNIPAGCHRLEYRIWDNCYNYTDLVCTVCVRDQIEPIAKCDDKIRISLGGGGFGKLTATELDEGSRDNCQLDSLLIRRVYTKDTANCSPLTEPERSPWRHRTIFGCCDVGDSVLVELRAVDVAGNDNICWAYVSVEDKIGPTCVPPPDTAIHCDPELLTGIYEGDTALLAQLFGRPMIADNCMPILEELPPDTSLMACGTGQVIRQFKVIDPSGNHADLCTQTIDILPNNEYKIKFPKDALDFCGRAPMPDTLEYEELACDLLAVSVSDKRFDGESDECYKIHRTYKVINWCEYDGESEPVIVDRDVDCDGLPGDEDIWVIVRPKDTTYYDVDGDETNRFPAANSRGGDCVPNPEGYWADSNQFPKIESKGFWQYTQVIKVIDNERPEVFVTPNGTFCVDQDDCTAEVTLEIGTRDLCARNDIGISFEVIRIQPDTLLERFDIDSTQQVLFGRYPKYTFVNRYEIGSYELIITIDDQCRNFTTDTVPFVVEDCKGPAPICINGLAAELMPLETGKDFDGDGDVDRGGTTVWATDFIASDVFDCSPPITYSINRVGEEPDSSRNALVVTCDDLGILEVELHAWDAVFNHDFCITYLDVQDNLFGLCSDPQNLIVNGRVGTVQDQPLPDVQMTMSGLVGLETYTDTTGSYTFDDIPLGADISILPYRSDTPLTGVSTYDIVLVMQHILGVRPLDNPYAVLAADVNQSRSVTTLDLIAMRKLILGLEQDWSTGEAWLFIPKSHGFANPSAPWDFPSVFSQNNVSEHLEGIDFVAVKRGDVSGALMLPGSSRARAQAQRLTFPGFELASGARVELPVYLEGAQSLPLRGAQFELAVDPDLVDLIGVSSTIISSEHLRLVDNRLRLSWNTPDSPVSEVPLLQLQLRARRSTNLAAALSLGTGLAPETYDAELQIHPLEMAPETSVWESTAFRTLPVFPNPADATPIWKAYCPESGSALLSVWLPTGQQISSRRVDLQQGWNELRLREVFSVATAQVWVSLEYRGKRIVEKVLLVR